MFHDRCAYPFVPGVVANGRVHWVNKNYFIVLVNRILTHPITVKHPQVAADATAHASLCNLAKVHGAFLLAHSLVAWFPVYNSLSHPLLAITAADAHPVDHKSLFLFITQTPSLNTYKQSTKLMDLNFKNLQAG